MQKYKVQTTKFTNRRKAIAEARRIAREINGKVEVRVLHPLCGRECYDAYLRIGSREQEIYHSAFGWQFLKMSDL